MADYKFLSFVFMALGFGLDSIGLVNFDYGASLQQGDNGVEYVEIGGFICATVALLLFVLIKFGELGSNRAAAISTIVFCFAAAALIILGIIWFGSDRHRNRDPPAYPTAILVTAAACSGLAGLFLTLETCNCKC